MHTRFFSSRGTPNTLVVSESLLVEGDIENLIMSPKLITCENPSRFNSVKQRSSKKQGQQLPVSIFSMLCTDLSESALLRLDDCFLMIISP